MTTIIASDNDFYDPLNEIGILQKDPAIIGGVTLGMLDFSNEESYVGAGAVAVGAQFKSLTPDESIATALTAFLPVAGGMLPIDSSVPSPRVTLPNTFKLAATVERFLVIVWAKLPASGWQTASSSTQQSLIGFMSNSTTLAQWGISLQTVQATGLPNGLVAYLPISSSSALGFALTNAQTMALCDGAPHQIAIYFDKSGGVTRTRSIYTDKLLRATDTVAWSGGNLSVPVANAQLGYNSAFQASYPAGVALGRPSIWDLTGSTLTPEEILEADWDAAQGFLS